MITIKTKLLEFIITKLIKAKFGASVEIHDLSLDAVDYKDNKVDMVDLIVNGAIRVKKDDMEKFITRIIDAKK